MYQYARTVQLFIWPGKQGSDYASCKCLSNCVIMVLEGGYIAGQSWFVIVAGFSQACNIICLPTDELACTTKSPWTSWCNHFLNIYHTISWITCMSVQVPRCWIMPSLGHWMTSLRSCIKMTPLWQAWYWPTHRIHSQTDSYCVKVQHSAAEGHWTLHSRHK